MEKPAPAEHPILDAIQRRWSPRAYDPRRTVDRETLNSLLEAARWAPSSRNEQPWRYLVFDGADAAARALAEDCLNPGNAWAKQAPVLILAVAKLKHARGDRPNRTALHDTGMATLSLVLQAVELGLIAHQMGGYDRAKARAAFKIPDDYEPVSMLAIGYYGDPQALEDPEDREDEFAARRRRPIHEFAFAGNWDVPFGGDPGDRPT